MRESSPLVGAASANSYGGGTGNDVERTPLERIAPLVDEARRTHSSGLTRPYAFRLSQLRGIEDLIRENSEAINAALAEDLGQGPMYCEAFETSHVIARARYAQRELRGWMAARRKPTPFPVNLNIPLRSELEPNPRGVATIITPWNLPIQLTFNPLIDALAAGNVCVLKMSERCVRTTELLTELLSSGRYVDKRAVTIINGGPEEAAELLKQRCDVIAYTGGLKVGRIVAKAAAENLTPVLLELGGKNPVFVTKNAHIPSAAMKVAWGKVTGNTGQMCICPDYVVVEESVKEEFTNELFKELDQLYPVSTYSNGGDGGDVGKMISVQHAERVVGLVDSTCRVIYGGKHHNTKERFVAPTVVEATADSTIMKEEIFGPILAIITVPSLDKGIEFVNKRHTSRWEHPLVLCIFSKSRKEQRRIMSAVPSGTCTVNDLLKHAASYYMPFGGLGTSGMGAYYGRHGFDFFSHYRGTLLVGNYSTWRWDPTVWLVNPPFDATKLLAFRALCRIPLILDALRSAIPVAKVAVPIALAVACYFNPSFLDAMLELNLKTILKWISQAFG